MFFSILIPVYNVEPYLRECVDSVLGQDEQDFEIILCDDGSTDRSGAICDEYHEKYPEKIRVIHKENEGLLFTRRRMLREAGGEWIVHLDSDDYMMPGALRAIRETIEKDERLDLILCKIAYGAKDGESVGFYSKLPFYDRQIFEDEGKQSLYRQLLAGGYMTAIFQKIARRDIVDIAADYSRFSRVSLAEDHLQSLPLLNNSRKAIFLDYPIIYYRYNGNSITKKKDFASYAKNIRSLLDVFREEEVYCPGWGLPEELLAKIAAEHLRTICNHIKNLMQNSGKDDRLKPFLRELRENETWNLLYRRSDKKTLGKFSRLCYLLIRSRNLPLLKLLCSLF